MLCKKCGATFPDTGIRCPVCGSYPLIRKDVKIFTPAQDRTSHKTLFLSIILLLLAAGIFYFIYHNRNIQHTEAQHAEVEQTDTARARKAQDKSPYDIEREISSDTTVTRSFPPPPSAEPSKNETAGYKKGERDLKTKKLSEIETHIEKEFQKKEGSHFTVRFEGGENADMGHLIAIILEEAFIKVGSDMGFYPEDRIEAVLYTRQQFTDVTRAPSWSGAIYDGRIKIPVGGITSRTALLERVLFHEYSHALVHRLSNGKAPVWLNEGIAQYEEGAASEVIKQVLSAVARSERPVSLRAFEGSFTGFNAAQAMVAYSVSLSATDYIIDEFGMSAVKRILEKLGEGKTLDEAIYSTIHISYEDLQKIWFLSLKRRFAG